MKLDFDKISTSDFLKGVEDVYGSEFTQDNMLILSRMFAMSRCLLFRDGTIERMRNEEV